jgi:hypothetical protein
MSWLSRGAQAAQADPGTRPSAERRRARPSSATAWLDWSPWPCEWRGATSRARDAPAAAAATSVASRSIDCRAAQRFAVALRAGGGGGGAAAAMAAAACAAALAMAAAPAGVCRAACAASALERYY